ncbi:hypothetical protein EAO73_27420 [Streptomyces sp. col6]|nr:hypothetical protein EAO73_27420 [Streptomyces sp. col6]
MNDWESDTAAAAGTRILGDVAVPRVGFGAMRLPQADKVLIPDAGGVPHIGTAVFFFSPLRSANELIKRALSPYPSDHVIATKVGQPRDLSGAWLPHAGRRELRGAGRGEPAPAGPRPPGPGEPTGTEREEVRKVARSHGVTPAQVRTAWTLHQGPHVLAIPGTGDPAHLQVAAGPLRLTSTELARLDAAHHSSASAAAWRIRPNPGGTRETGSDDGRRVMRSR